LAFQKSILFKVLCTEHKVFGRVEATLKSAHVSVQKGLNRPMAAEVAQCFLDFTKFPM